ncbi:hypothetical protein BYT27DRAFT_7207550 [Phlegmacium glaucopus]|nr:hypothetical protein BYT27DRAFT_7207550 [Phlegmacium glaucopus]
MAKGCLQLAMDDSNHSNNHMTHDTEAIHWVLSKITEDSQFEPFAAGIGGSLATPWGEDIWKNIFGDNSEKMHLTPYDTVIASDTVQTLKIHIESLLRSCTVSTFSDQQEDCTLPHILRRNPVDFTGLHRTPVQDFSV